MPDADLKFKKSFSVWSSQKKKKRGFYQISIIQKTNKQIFLRQTTALSTIFQKNNMLCVSEVVVQYHFFPKFFFSLISVVFFIEGD